MKITKRQLKRIIKEEKAKLINEDAFDNVMRTASQILGPNIELDEEMDGNIIIVADEMDVEANYDQLMAAFPNGEMVEDGFVTGVMQESKISKRQLRRIIKEEKAKILAEQKIRRTVRRKLLEQAGQGLVLIPGFTSYVAPLSEDGLHAATSGHRELPPGPWQEAWDNEDTPAVVAELSKLGVTHIGGDDGEGIAEMMGLPGSVVTLDQFARLNA